VNTKFPLISLGEIASPVERLETPVAGHIYRQLGVRLWGVGAYERESMDGSQTKYKQLSRVETNDIVVNKIWARNGSVAVVPESLSGCFVSGEFPTFAPHKKQLNPRWFHWFTKTRPFWNQCDEKSRGTSGQNRIRPEQFLKVEIPLPSLSEQRRIVARIEELSAKVEEARGLRQKSKTETQKLMPSILNGIFTSTAFKQHGTVMLGEIADIKSGVTLGRNLQGITIRLPYLRVANVQEGRLDLSLIKEVEILEHEKDKWSLQKGDVLLTEGGDWDKLGRGTVWNEEIPNCIHQNHIFRVRVSQHEFMPEYLCALLSSPYGKEYFQSASKQTTNLASINQRQLKAFVVFRPSLLEQAKIVEQIKLAQAKIDSVKQLQLETAAELDALMPTILDRAFKGELKFNNSLI